MCEPKISFCTTIKNRLHHIRETLRLNLAEHQNKNVEFILMDYNSSDGLEEYIKSAYGNEIANGKIVYYKNLTEAHYNRSHSRNMAFKLAQGEIVCNLDADNYTGRGFSDYVYSKFTSNQKLIITGVGNSLNVIDAMGKICIKKNDFMEVTGYDETFEGYGFEDIDLVHRLKLNGTGIETIQERSFLQSIPHTDSERVAEEKAMADLHSLYVHYIDADSSEILILKKDNSFVKGTVVNTQTSKDHVNNNNKRLEWDSLYRFSMKGEGWTTGKWADIPGGLVLQSNDNARFYIHGIEKEQELIQSDDHLYYRVSSTDMITEGIFFYMQIRNRDKMVNNYKSGNIYVNKRFGEGIAYKNFDYLTPIAV